MFPPNHWALPIVRLLERAGNSGFYQIRCLLLFSVQWMITSFFLMGYEFLFLPPILMCYNADAEQSTAVQCTEQVACRADKNYYLSDDSVYSLAYEFDLVCDNAHFINVCNAALFIGGGLGAYYYAEMQERKGRLSTMIYTISLAAVIAMLSILSFNIYMFAAASFLMHFALRGYLCASVVYFSEISDDNYRIVGPCIFYAFWALGQMLFSFLISYIATSWTAIMFYFIGAPFFISALYFRFMKESPRYCVVQHRFGEAKDAIMGIARINNTPMADFSIDEQNKVTKPDQIFSSTLQDALKPPERRFNYHMLTLFKYLSLKKPSFVILYFTSLLNVLFYNTSISISTVAVNPYLNLFILGFVQFFAYLFTANAALNYRRKSCFRVIFIMIGISYLFFAFFHADINDPDINLAHLSMFVVFVIVSKLAISGGMALFMVYICEVYPTVIRHFAMGFFDTFTKLAIVFSVQFVGMTNTLLIGPLIPISLLSFGTLYVMTYIPETLDQAINDYIEEEKPLLYDRVDREREMSKLFGR